MPKPVIVPPGPPGSPGFSLRFGSTRTETSAAVKKALEKSRVFHELVTGLNRDLSVPARVAVELVECGEANAFYDPDRRSITLCYDLVALISRSFDDIKSDDEHSVATLGAAVFIAVHELGHALIDTLSLSFTGREEDAVDQLATLLLVESGPDGVQAARDGAALFARLAGERQLEQVPLWAEHSLEEQRFFNVLCWIYGSDPDGQRDLVERRALPPDRAQRCGAEWVRLRGAWVELLRPHQKNAGATRR